MRTFFSILIVSLFFVPHHSLLGQTYELSPTGIGLTGGMSTQNGLELRQSIGEPVIETWTIQASELRQGFQQSVNGTTTALDQFPELSESLLIYPQPAREQLTTAWNGQEVLAGTVTWFDLSGRQIQEMTQPLYLLPGETRQIDLHSLAPGTYLMILNGEKGLQLGSWPVIRLP